MTVPLQQLKSTPSCKLVCESGTICQKKLHAYEKSTFSVENGIEKGKGLYLWA